MYTLLLIPLHSTVSAAVESGEGNIEITKSCVGSPCFTIVTLKTRIPSTTEYTYGESLNSITTKNNRINLYMIVNHVLIIVQNCSR